MRTSACSWADWSGEDLPVPNDPLPTGNPITAENTWVLICTYRRNDLLSDLLDSLISVQMPESTQLRSPQLIVVDNAPEPEAEDLVRTRLPEALCLHQPLPGIVHARNTALDQVPDDAEAVIFIDDDERVGREWFTAMLDCAISSGADAVGGPVIADFQDGEPDWVATYGYVRRTDRPTGPGPKRLGAGNTLIRARWFTTHGLRFDEAFNLTGGEDSELFDRIRSRGGVFWWCAEAVALERVPAHRATKTWLRARARRGGLVRAMKQAKTSGSRRARPRIAAEGVARIGYGGWRVLSRRVRGQPVTYLDEYYLHEGLGMVASVAGRGHVEYARN